MPNRNKTFHQYQFITVQAILATNVQAPSHNLGRANYRTLNHLGDLHFLSYMQQFHSK